MKNPNEAVILLLEIDPEKKVFYISDYAENNEKGLARKYKNKKDIVRIFKNFLFNSINLYPPKEIKKEYHGRKKQRKH